MRYCSISLLPASGTISNLMFEGKYLKYVYTGNIYDEEGKNTYCPSCSKPVIVRGYGYSPITEINLKGNKCKFCGETINLKTW